MSVCWLLACCLGATPPAAKSAGATKSSALDSAVAELKREYAAHLKDPTATPLRKACDYFADPAKGTVSTDALLAALEKPMPGDARQAAYVKWQLLSAWPADADEKAVGRLVKVYGKAPVPAARYGMSAKERKQLDRTIAGARPEDDVKFNEKLEQAAATAGSADKPVIAYRDELYNRLPLGKPKLLAALQDAHARVSVAADKDALADALEQDLSAWAAASASAAAPAAAAAASPVAKADLREVADLVGKLRFVESPPYYAYASVRSGTLAWRTRTDTLYTKKRFLDLHKLMLDAAGETAGGATGSAAAKATKP